MSLVTSHDLPPTTPDTAEPLLRLVQPLESDTSSEIDTALQITESGLVLSGLEQLGISEETSERRSFRQRARERMQRFNDPQGIEAITLHMLAASRSASKAHELATWNQQQ